ncbi:MAG TPA: hypothetical protein VHB21_13410 [Minicystis sp.]|nr:hypothetical protein [Minicystis sp.]
MIAVHRDLGDRGRVRLRRDAALVLLVAERPRRVVVGVLAIDVARRRREPEVHMHRFRQRAEFGHFGRARSAMRAAERRLAVIEHDVAFLLHLGVGGEPVRVEVHVLRRVARGDEIEAERVPRPRLERLVSVLVLVFDRRDLDGALGAAALAWQRPAAVKVDDPRPVGRGDEPADPRLVTGVRVGVLVDADLVDGDDQVIEIDLPAVDELDGVRRRGEGIPLLGEHLARRGDGDAAAAAGRPGAAEEGGGGRDERGAERRSRSCVHRSIHSNAYTPSRACMRRYRFKLGWSPSSSRNR